MSLLKQFYNSLQSKWSLIIIVVFYLGAGINHFINPSFYFPLIPDYLPYHEWINYLSGISEVLLALGMLIKNTRKLASILLIVLLLLFIPAHIHFINIGSCIDEGLCVAPWLGWLRLIVIHPLLLFWAYAVGKSTAL